MVWTAQILTIFPTMFPGPLGQSLAGKALEKNIWSLNVTDIRDYAKDKHHTVDDVPYGGGAGMVMRPDVIGEALENALLKTPSNVRKIYLSPRGKKLTQAFVKELSEEPGMILLCGRYEGIDERVLQAYDMEEISIGDYILSGGEIAALTLLDACVRLLPNVMGNATTIDEESFETGLLEYPHYTRPASWRGLDVPEVLTSGHHAKVKAWRKAEAERITQVRRPDLWAHYQNPNC